MQVAQVMQVVQSSGVRQNLRLGRAAERIVMIHVAMRDSRRQMVGKAPVRAG